MGPDIVRWGGGQKRGGVGAKKFGMPLETKGKQTFSQDIPGFCRDIPGSPEKFEKKYFVFNFSAPSVASHASGLHKTMAEDDAHAQEQAIRKTAATSGVCREGRFHMPLDQETKRLACQSS